MNLVGTLKGVSKHSNYSVKYEIDDTFFSTLIEFQKIWLNIGFILYRLDFVQIGSFF